MANQGISPAIAELLATRRDEMVGQWAERVAADLRGRQSTQELEQELGTLFDAIAATAGDGSPDEVRSILNELSRSRARQGFSPRETATSIFTLKDVVLERLASRYEDGMAFSRYVDELGLSTFESYAAAREAVISDQANQLLELSTPVVKLWDGVVAVPLVGTLDSARTQVVMEKLLETLVETESTYAIIDITGVPAVDTQVAQHLLKTAVAARLMGAECVISGIRPQIAQTIVALGIEFGDIVTKSSLADALALALRESGVEVVSAKRT